MKIREGAYYRTRGGNVVGPMQTRDSFCYCWESGTDCWTDKGEFEESKQLKHDLISEVYVFDTPPPSRLERYPAPPADAPSPEAKTLRDEFASDWMKGVLANPNHADRDMESFACMAYRMADAMMKARKK